ncbi:MAG: hypothetical protein LLG14_04545 [Nocardiaceae bacterium]|nr:hypothetical protein [Nocardiaceae bacterium]
MFIQIIKGQVSDPAALKARLDEWQEALAPGATGWLGSTGGVTDDGTFFGIVRFSTEQSAQANSGRPQQGEWWASVEPLVSNVEFQNCVETMSFGKGGSDDAGFVQIMQGRVKDAAALKAFNEEHEADFENFRDDVIGGVTALHGDGGYTDVIYFTSEAEARDGEKQEMPENMAAMMNEMMSLYEGEPTYYDIKEPWLHSPK